MIRAVDLISPSYLELQRQLHADPRGYGAKGGKWAQTVLQLLDVTGSWSVLDYGCGQGALGRALEGHLSHGRVREYDPAVEGKDQPPGFADLIVITDVLEHIEPERLSSVLAHLHLLARKAVFFVVALDPAAKMLADGRNAHLVESATWWEQRIVAAGFTVRGLPSTVPIPLTPTKRALRWMALGVPTCGI